MTGVGRAAGGGRYPSSACALRAWPPLNPISPDTLPQRKIFFQINGKNINRLHRRMDRWVGDRETESNMNTVKLTAHYCRFCFCAKKGLTKLILYYCIEMASHIAHFDSRRAHQ